MISWLLVVTSLSGIFAMIYGVFATVHDFHAEKDGKKVLSRMGYIGLTILLFSSSLGLLVDVYKEISEARGEAIRTQTENERLEEARARDREMNIKLGLQLESSKETSSDLLQALTILKGNAQTSVTISSNLNRQLGVTRNISKEMATAVRSLDKTSETASAVLAETVERIDQLEVYVVVLVDPLAIRDLEGKPALSAESLRLVALHKAGQINLWEDEDKQAIIGAEVRRHYALLRTLVFQDWSVIISLDRGSEEWFDFFPDTVILYEGDTGVSAFTSIPQFDDEKVEDILRGLYRLPCLVTYKIQPDRYAGFRKYSDLNGVDWEVVVKTRDESVQLHGVFLSTGYFQTALELLRSEFTVDDGGALRGAKEIPVGFFKPHTK